MDDRFATRCTFRAFRGARVCVPDNMGRVTLGICDPKGGPDRVWVNREPNCLGDGTSKYVLYSAQELDCSLLGGTIGVTDLAAVSDQTLYLGSQATHKCDPSPLSGNPQHPVQNIAPPPAPVYIYEDDLPSKVCQ